MVCNIYKSCDHGCRYCYVNGYSNDVIQGKRNPGFVKRLQRDLDDFAFGKLPKGPIHISNSTDPLQVRLETKYRDTYQTLKLLSNYKNNFSEIIILTKNPGLLLNSEIDYLSVISDIKNLLTIEISIAFYRDNFKSIEPEAVHPLQRLKALRELVDLGFNIRLRLDPIFPEGNGIQTHDDIISILDSSEGVECVISKPLRLVKPKKGQADQFFKKMTVFYQGGKKSGVEWHGGRYVYSAIRAKEEMAFLSAQCSQRSIPLVHCKETVLVDQTGTPLIKKILSYS